MLPVLHTSRLVIRPVRPDDLDPLFERRNDPQVAGLQAWDTPYPRERAEEVVTEVLAMDGNPVDGQWFMATVVEAATGEVVGELVMHPTNELRTAEVGYSLSTRHWGKGYAVEALEAFVAWIIEALPVTRVSAMLHPDNRASAMVLERTGFLFEGHTRLSFWLGDDNSDDWIYGMTRAEWQAWRDRPRTPPADVRLVPVTQANKAAVLALRTHHSQRAFVAPMLDSFADALLPDIVDGAPVVPWMRAIEADGADRGVRDAGPDHAAPPGALPVAPADRPDAPAPRDRLPRVGADRRRVPRDGRLDPAGQLGRGQGLPAPVLPGPRVRAHGPGRRRRDGGAPGTGLTETHGPRRVASHAPARTGGGGALWVASQRRCVHSPTTMRYPDPDVHRATAPW